MQNEQLKEILNKVPLVPIVAAYLGFMGFQYWDFTTNPMSDLLMKQGQFEALKNDNTQVSNKIKAANEFYKTLDAKRIELRALAQRLDEFKATLNDQLDVPSFMKMLVTEATRLSIKVISIKPKEQRKKEYYQEQPFEIRLEGPYLLLSRFLDRLANVEQIVRVDEFDIKRIGASTAAFPMLSASIEVKTFRYVGTQADDIATKTKPAQ